MIEVELKFELSEDEYNRINAFCETEGYELEREAHIHDVIFNITDSPKGGKDFDRVRFYMGTQSVKKIAGMRKMWVEVDGEWTRREDDIDFVVLPKYRKEFRGDGLHLVVLDKVEMEGHPVRYFVEVEIETNDEEKDVAELRESVEVFARHVLGVTTPEPSGSYLNIFGLV